MNKQDFLDIANSALIACGINKTIQDADETSAEARVAKRLFKPVLDGLLSEYNWRFATKISALSLVNTVQSPNGASDFWRYTYKYPSDCIRLFSVLPPPRDAINASASVMASDSVYSKVGNFLVRENLQDTPYIGVRMFETYTSDRGRIIVTNIERAYGRYVSNNLASNSYPPLFRQALVYKMAHSMLLSMQGSNEQMVAQLLQFSIRDKTLAIQADSGEGVERMNTDPFAIVYDGRWS